MGAINNAFNQVAGTVAGAALAVKHAKETDFSKTITAEHSALVAKNQASEAEQAANEAKLEEPKVRSDSIDAIISSFGKDEEYYAAKKEYDDKIEKGQIPSQKAYKAVEKTAYRMTSC